FAMRLSIENLKQGMNWWQKGNWPTDYLNDEYYKIFQVRAGGLTEEWLTITVGRLAQWRAIRSRKPPNTKAGILALLEAKLPELRTEYQRIQGLSSDEPSTTIISWQDIARLYEI